MFNRRGWTAGQKIRFANFELPVGFDMARTFDVVVLNIHPTADKTVVVAEVRYTPTQDNVDLPTSGTGRQTIAQVKQQKTIVHVWGDYRDRKKDELSKDPKFRNFAMHEAEQLINNYLNERGLLS